MPVAKGTIPSKINPKRNLVSGVSVAVRPPAPSDGNCSGKPTEWWYTPNDSSDRGDFAKAAELCSTCPVKYPCLMYSLEWEEYGTWGGLSEFQRDNLRKVLGSPRHYRDDSRRRFQEDRNTSEAFKRAMAGK